MKYYFAYGSNMDPKQMRERCPSAQAIDKAYLPDHSLEFTIYSPRRKCGCADIVYKPNSSVWGILYEISDTDLAALDAFEGHPQHYRRTQAQVIQPNGKTIRCETYEVANKQAHISPSEDYLEKMQQAADAYDFPEEYRMFLAGIRTID